MSSCGQFVFEIGHFIVCFLAEKNRPAQKMCLT